MRGAPPPPIVADCDDCGACCLVVTRPPFVRRLDGTAEPGWERLGRERPDLVAAIESAVRLARAEGTPDYGAPCLWYDPATRGCRHYDLRPSACRAFAVGSVDCLDARRRAGVTAGRPDPTS